MGSARSQVRVLHPEARRRPGRAARRARRRGLVRLTVLILVVALIICLGVWVTKASGSAQPVAYEARAGDTVWGIAERTYGADTDLRRAVYEIERLNGVCAGDLQPGDELMLPVESSL